MSQSGTVERMESKSDPRVRVIHLGAKEYVAVFWDESTSTHAVQWWSLDVSVQYPLEERVWRAQQQMTDSEAKALAETFDLDLRHQGLTDANRRAVPTRAMTSAVLASSQAPAIDESTRLSIPTNQEIDSVVEAIDAGLMNWDSGSHYGNRRDLRGRHRALQAAKEYLIARLYWLDDKPAIRVCDALNLDSPAQARNIIQRARNFGYLTREEDGLAFGTNAAQAASDLRLLVNRAKEARANNS
jgi:hypothetical protein